MDNNSIYVPRPDETVRENKEAEKVTNTVNVPKPAGISSDEFHKKYLQKKEEDRIKGIANFELFGLYTVLYGIIATFCTYKNPRGIAVPFFVAATLIYYVCCIKKAGITLKSRGNRFYMVSIMLLGISVFLTEDSQMTGLAKITMFILILVFGLHNCFDDSEWRLFSYLQALGTHFIKIFENLPGPFADAGAYFKDMVHRRREDLDEDGRPKKNNMFYVVLGIVISIPILIVVLNLLCAADAVFKEACRGFFELIQIENVAGVLFTFVIIYVIFYAIMRFLLRERLEIAHRDRRVQEPVLAITITAILTLVYVIFCVIQILYLFWGEMELPEEYTYAEYAHEGFYQLLAVCVINLVIVLIATNIFRRHKVLDIILTVICVCTYIMIASSGYRMYMYVNCYDLSRMRIYVFIGLAVLSILMIGVIISIYSNSFPLFHYGVTVMTIAIIITVYSHPSTIVAAYNVHQYKTQMDSIDMEYLTELPLDAGVIILDVDNFSALQVADDMEYLRDYYESYDSTRDLYELDYVNEKMSFRTFNVSKFLARKSYEKLVTYDPYADYESIGYNF